MDMREFDKWVAAYIMYQSDPERDMDDHPLFWAAEKFMELVDLDEVPEIYFKAILGILAAGPLEDLIQYHGSQYIDRIEQEARCNPEFRHLLGGVWKSSTPDIWARVERARGNPW